jgi:hypothetical protein
MGLLDEAIREHLELKRRRGADPTEVAREEQEALEPIFPDEAPAAAVEGAQAEALQAEAEASPVYEPDAHADQPVEAPPAPLGEETVEIDMQAVLDADVLATGQQAEATSDPVRAPAPAQEEGFEWEHPDRASDEPPSEPLPGQERLSFE